MHAATAAPRPRVGLALGGGVWRGWAHLGVLAVLAREGIAVDYIAGASAGAIVGALFSAGLPVERMIALSEGMRWRDFARLAWPPRQGLVSFAGLEWWLARQLGDCRFDQLALPFAAVATDLARGEPVVLCEGRVAPAVRASCSVPGFVTPTQIGGRLLGDGGVSNNLPADVVRTMGAEVVIGVDLFTPRLRPRWGPLGVAFAAIETMVRQSGGGRHLADCLITPELGGASYLRSTEEYDLIALGRAAAEASLPAIRAVLTR